MRNKVFEFGTLISIIFLCIRLSPNDNEWARYIEKNDMKGNQLTLLLRSGLHFHISDYNMWPLTYKFRMTKRLLNAICFPSLELPKRYESVSEFINFSLLPPPHAEYRESPY